MFGLGQACIAGARIYVQEGIYDQFLRGFTRVAEDLTKAIGGPFDEGVQHGPQVSQTQYNVCLGTIRFICPGLYISHSALWGIYPPASRTAQRSTLGENVLANTVTSLNRQSSLMSGQIWRSCKKRYSGPYALLSNLRRRKVCTV